MHSPALLLQNWGALLGALNTPSAGVTPAASITLDPQPSGTQSLLLVGGLAAAMGGSAAAATTPSLGLGSSSDTDTPLMVLTAAKPLPRLQQGGLPSKPTSLGAGAAGMGVRSPSPLWGGAGLALTPAPGLSIEAPRSPNALVSPTKCLSPPELAEEAAAAAAALPRGCPAVNLLIEQYKGAGVDSLLSSAEARQLAAEAEWRPAAGDVPSWTSEVPMRLSTVDLPDRRI